MNTKYIIAAVVIVVIIISAVGIILYYPGGNSGSGYVVTLVDDQGYETSLEAYPTKIISLAPSTTEILFALDDGDKVVGLTDYDNYPYDFAAWFAAGNMTSVGSFDEPNLEVIASLAPDLIIMTGGVQDETAVTLRDLGYNVLVLNPTSIDDVLQNIVLVGKATDKNAEATAIIDDIQNRIDAVETTVADAESEPTVYYEVWYDPTSLWTAGSQAWQNELIEKAGGVNLFADQNQEYFLSSAEAVIERDPDVMILPSSHGVDFWESFDAVKARPGWDTINAIQNDKLYEIDSDLIARAGPRIADAVEALAELFHPELF